MKKDILKLARDELLKLDQTVRDCSDRFMELTPLDLETARLRQPLWSQRQDSGSARCQVTHQKKELGKIPVLLLCLYKLLESWACRILVTSVVS